MSHAIPLNALTEAYAALVQARTYLRRDFTPAGNLVWDELSRTSSVLGSHLRMLPDVTIDFPEREPLPPVEPGA